LNDREASIFIFLSNQNDTIFYKRDAKDEEEILQNDPFQELVSFSVFPLTDLMFHSLQLDQLAQSKHKPNKYMISGGWNCREATFDFYLLRDAPSFMSATTRILIGKKKMEGSTYLKHLTFAKMEGTLLTYYYVKGCEIHTVHINIAEELEKINKF
jgi:hypothetical protein